MNVAVVHAAPSYATLTFLRERRAESTLEYRGAGQASFEVDQYDFNVEATPPNAVSTVPVGSFSQVLTADNEYYFVLAELGGIIAPIAIEKPTFDPASSEAEVTIVHAAEQLAAVDVYIELSGTDLATATPRGSLDFGEHLAPASLAAGERRLTLTAPNQPTSVLFRSAPQTFVAGQPELLVITDGASEGLADTVILRAGAGAGTGFLYDENEPSGLRIINVAADRSPRDVYLDGDFTAPFLGNLVFGQAPNHELLTPEPHDLAVTPAGSPNVIELEQPFTPVVGRLFTILLGENDDDALVAAVALEDRRPIADRARVVLLHGATQFANLDFLLVEPGTDLATVFPLARLNAPTITQFGDFPPDDYEFALRDPATGTIVAPAVPMTLEGGGVYSILVLNAADAATADVVLLDGFN